MSLKNLTIGSRVLIGSALVSVLSVALILPIALSKLAHLSDRAEVKALEDHYYSLSGGIASQGELAQSLSALVSRIPVVQQAFAEGDRDRLREITRPIFDYMSKEYAVRQFQFLTPPATSFLRVHMLERYGDDLTAIRKTIVEANRSRKPVRGLERGVAGLGVRGVEPVFYQGRHIGVVEFGMSFGQPFFDRFKKDTSVEAALQIPDGAGFKTFASTLEQGTLFSDAQLQRIMDGEVLVRRIELEGEPVAVYGRLVGDFSGNPVGVLELAVDRSETIAVFDSAFYWILGVGLVVILDGLALAWITARGISRPIRETRERLASIAEGDGDLRLRLQADGRNELADLARAFNTFVERIQNLVARVSGASAHLSSAAEELSLNSSETNRQVKEEQNETDQVATAINQMTATVEEVARRAPASRDEASPWWRTRCGPWRPGPGPRPRISVRRSSGFSRVRPASSRRSRRARSGPCAASRMRGRRATHSRASPIR
ncbi:Methyl-accepting chemotaxis protein [Imhoffiella purpurea]|uniref:Methyl-accepting chemotaxis protein n=1 Tax=Imhoffiella purpurea TaxID=1249627 RepID=W9V5U7_9GAMM|nr:Methyl-accepting chemotaxis protein [Imhoffiella purpurea]